MYSNQQQLSAGKASAMHHDLSRTCALLWRRPKPERAALAGGAKPADACGGGPLSLPLRRHIQRLFLRLALSCAAAKIREEKEQCSFWR